MILKYIKGDRVLWVIAIMLALFSMMPVYSASSNLAFLHGGSTFSMLSKHAIHLVLGLILMYAAHNIPYRHFAAFSVIMMPIIAVLLLYTMFQGVNVANASRWIRLPFVGWTFQTSALAAVVLMVYLARALTKTEPEDLKSFKKTFLPIIGPILLVCGLILPSNFSTAALVFAISVMVLFIGGYTIKNILIIIGGAIAAFALFILLVMAFPGISNRVETWKNRIENYSSDNPDDIYQVHKAKMAIAEGKIIGKGPGKSIQKNFLPQSNSDFIFAVIVEEFGLIGAVLVVFFYILFLIRTLMITTKAPTQFGSLIAIGMGLIVIVQAFINLGVAVNLLPVTGQTLPLISAGGSSIWMTCIAIGIILSVSRGLPTKEQEMEGVEPELAHA